MSTPGVIESPSDAIENQTPGPSQVSSSGPEQPYHSASLYVGDLAPDVNEGLLFEIFNAMGPVSSIRVCRDAITRRSLGYAYVNFHHVADAERALETMNYTMIKTKPCRIMWSQRDPSLRRSGVGNIFVKNLHTSIDNKQLYDTFSLFGNILSCKVVTDREGGTSKGYGYVHYETNEAAQAAIEKLDGMLIDGQEVQVGVFMRRNERPGQNDWTNCYVKNIPFEWDDDTLKKEFSQFGEVISAAVSMGYRKKTKAPTPDDGQANENADESQKEDESKFQSLGYGFVNFAEHDGAITACEFMNGKEFKSVIDGEEKSLEMYVGRAQKKSERERELRAKFEAEKMDRISKFQGVNLYVKNLDDSVTDELLREEFASMGTITSARVMKDAKHGQSKGFGFVCFSTPEEATRAVNEMNGKLIAAKPIFVGLAQRRDARRAQLEAQHATRTPGPAGPGNPGIMRGPMGGPIGFPGGMPPMYMPRAGPGGAMQPAYPMMPQMMAPGGRGPGQRPAAGYPVMGQQGRGGYPMPYGVIPQPGRGGRAPLRGRGPMPMQNAPGQPIKFNQQVRNAITPSGMLQQQPAPMVPQPQTHEGALTASALVSATPEMQKNMIGERLYPLIYSTQPELAGKITGMLLEMDNSELLHLLESPEALNSKISEALQVLEAHGQGSR
jgi:polyadenylate-binding protein